MRTIHAAIIVAALAGTAALAKGAHARAAVPPIPIQTLPIAVAGWHGEDAGDLDRDTLRQLAADAYLNRTYRAPAQAPLGLYVAYYTEPRPGVSIHSPLHCLPGTGWETEDVAMRAIDGAGPGRGGQVRRLVIRKGAERAVVLYWYAVRGRMIGSEVASKAWLLHDSFRFHRSDAALVRIVVPVRESIESAEREGIAFTRTIAPYVSRLWS